MSISHSKDHPPADPKAAPAQSERKPANKVARAIRYLLGQIPTVAVLAALGGIAWWGSQNDWTVPGFSKVAATPGPAEKEDWCAEHNVPDSQCIACHPELAGASAADWCKEHGVPESRCTVCHPEVLTKGVASDWCIDHGVPESCCTVCHEEIAVLSQAPPDGSAIRVLGPDGTTLPATAPAPKSRPKPNMAHSLTPTTRPGKDPRTCQTHARRIQFASAESVRKAGIELAQVVERPMSATVTGYASVDYDRTRLAQVSPPVSGKAWRVDKQVGDLVRAGDVLALVESADVGKAKADLLEALAATEARTKSLARLKASAQSGFRTEAEVQEAQAGLQEARVKLYNAQQAMANLGLPVAGADLADAAGAPDKVRFLGLPESVVKSLDGRTTTDNLVAIAAPLEGVVISREIVAGERVDPGKVIFTVADPSRLSVVMDLSPDDARPVQLGQPVVFRPDAAKDRPAGGKVSWISTSLDEQTRTLRVRSDVQNPGGALAAKSFGQAQITVRSSPNVIAVPDEAVQWEGCCYVVFVRLTDTVFQTRKVRIGTSANGFTEVLVGVLPGEVVATTGSHVLKAEILKSNLGAGCCAAG